MANTISDGDYFIINARSALEGYNANVDVWQYYSYDNDDYIYTTDYAVYKHATYWHGYRADGVAFKLNGSDRTTAVHEMAYGPTGATLDNKPEYRKHRYVVADADISALKGDGWVDNGIVFYGNASGAGHCPVYKEHVDRNGGVYWLGSYIDEGNGWVNDGIVFYAGGIFALDVNSDSQEDYANAQLWWPDETNAQIWTVSTRSDGSRRIMNRFSGKNLDVIGGFWNTSVANSYVSGQNIGMYHDWNQQELESSSVANRGYAWNQAWQFIDSGKTAKYQDTTYSVFNIGLFEGDYADIQKDWRIGVSTLSDSSSMTPGLNVDIAKADDGDDQGWIFVPVPPFRPNEGVYTIRPLWSDNMRLTCSGPPYVNATNVYIHGENGSPNQYWAFLKSDADGKYKIRNLGGSSMYLDVYGGETDISNGTNVDIATYDAHTMDWRLTRYEDLLVDGVLCPVARIDVDDSNGKTYSMDIDNALNENNSNVLAWESSDNGNQRWILHPEIGVAASDVPVPANCYVDLAVQRNDLTNAVPYATGVKDSSEKLPSFIVYPTWTCTDAWFAGDNVYQFRYRYRMMRPNGSYIPWTDYSVWYIPPITMDGARNRAWITDGVDAKWYTKDYIVKQYEFDVRCIGTSEDETSNIFGGTASWNTDIVLIPKYDFTEAGMSYDGLHLGFTMDYKANGNVFITGIFRSSAPTSNLLYTDVPITGIKNSSLYHGNEHSVIIPYANLKQAPNDGDNLIVRYEVGCLATNSTDSLYRLRGSYTDATVTVKAAVGNVAAEPDIYACYRHTGFVTLPEYSTSRIWYYHGGEVDELKEYTGTAVTKPSGTKMFVFPYTWGDKTAKFATSIQSNDRTKWGSFYGDVDISSLDPSRVHLWTDSDNHIVCIDCRQGDKLESKISLESDANKVVLNDREHEMVTFGKTIKNNFQIEGAIMHSDEFGYTDCTTKEIEALVSTHQVYRNPKGDIMNVAVTAVSVTGHHDWDAVTVSMTEETI